MQRNPESFSVKFLEEGTREELQKGSAGRMRLHRCSLTSADLNDGRLR